MQMETRYAANIGNIRGYPVKEKPPEGKMRNNRLAFGVARPYRVDVLRCPRFLPIPFIIQIKLVIG
jgi:hypothetical protein